MNSTIHTHVHTYGQKFGKELNLAMEIGSCVSAPPN